MLRDAFAKAVLAWDKMFDAWQDVFDPNRGYSASGAWEREQLDKEWDAFTDSTGFKRFKTVIEERQADFLKAHAALKRKPGKRRSSKRGAKKR
jgi:hypothetical protein